MAVTAKQMIAAMQAKPMFSNSVLINRGAGGLVRITFGEEFAGEGVVYHAAVLMHEREAVDMASALLQVLAPKVAEPAPAPQPNPDTIIGEQFAADRRVPRFDEPFDPNAEYTKVIERLQDAER